MEHRVGAVFDAFQGGSDMAGLEVLLRSHPSEATDSLKRGQNALSS